MQIDRRTLEMVQHLSDAQLEMILQKLQGAGVDLRAYGITDPRPAAVRQTLRNLTDADIVRAGEQYRRWQQDAKRGRP